VRVLLGGGPQEAPQGPEGGRMSPLLTLPWLCFYGSLAISLAVCLWVER
jgi:hypothetical protein